jgi:hypothetical protein
MSKRLRRSHVFDFIIITVVLAFWVGRWIWLMIDIHRGRPDRLMDFATYYVAARALWEGKDLYQIDGSQWFALGKESGIPTTLGIYVYPPLFAILMALLAWLPFSAAAMVWGAITWASFLGSAYLFARWVRLSTWPFLLCALLFLPVSVTMNYGQSNGILLFLILLAWISLHAPSAWTQGRGAVALSIAIWVKTWPALLGLYFLSRKFLRPLLWTGIAFLWLGGLQALILGSERWISFLRVGLPDLLRLLMLQPPHNPLWRSFSGPLFDSARPHAMPLAALPFVLLVTWLLLRRSHLGSVYDLSLVLSLIPLIARFQEYHHLVLLLIPLWTLIAEGARGALPRLSWVLAMGGGMIVNAHWILGWLVVRRGLGIGAPLYTSYTLPLLGTFLIWMALAWSRLAWQMEAPIIKRTRDEADAPASGDGE